MRANIEVVYTIQEMYTNQYKGETWSTTGVALTRKDAEEYCAKNGGRWKLYPVLWGDTENCA